MQLSARLGRYELCRAMDADGAARRPIASAGDALALLRQLRCDASIARALVHAAGARVPLSRASDDALRALAVLLWRGTYVLLELGPGFRVPPLESPPRQQDEHEPEREAEEDAEDGHPPAIVPPEYPRVAAYIAGGLDASVAEAHRRLEEQRYRMLPPMPLAQVPDAYRDIGADKQREIKAAAHYASLKLERMMHFGHEIADPTQLVPDTYRELAESKRSHVAQSAGRIADTLDRFLYAGDPELDAAEGSLHSNALPPVLRNNTDVKVRAVRDSTSVAATRLDSLLYRGFE